MNILETLENLNVSEECFNDILDIVEGWWAKNHNINDLDAKVKNSIVSRKKKYEDAIITGETPEKIEFLKKKFHRANVLNQHSSLGKKKMKRSRAVTYKYGKNPTVQALIDTQPGKEPKKANIYIRELKNLGKPESAKESPNMNSIYTPKVLKGRRGKMLSDDIWGNEVREYEKEQRASNKPEEATKETKKISHANEAYLNEVSDKLANKLLLNRAFRYGVAAGSGSKDHDELKKKFQRTKELYLRRNKRKKPEEREYEGDIYTKYNHAFSDGVEKGMGNNSINPSYLVKECFENAISILEELKDNLNPNEEPVKKERKNNKQRVYMRNDDPEKNKINVKKWYNRVIHNDTGDPYDNYVKIKGHQYYVDDHGKITSYKNK